MFTEFLLSQNVEVKNVDQIFQKDIGEGVGHCPKKGLILINKARIKEEEVDEESLLVHEFIHHLQHKLSGGKRLPKETFVSLCGEYPFKSENSEKSKQAALYYARFYPQEEFGIELEAYYLQFIVQFHMGIENFIKICQEVL